MKIEIKAVKELSPTGKPLFEYWIDGKYIGIQSQAIWNIKVITEQKHKELIAIERSEVYDEMNKALKEQEQKSDWNLVDCKFVEEVYTFNRKIGFLYRDLEIKKCRDLILEDFKEGMAITKEIIENIINKRFGDL